MILDAQNQYASGQTLAASGASTNVLDHGSDRNLGIGEPLVAVIQVTAIDAGDGDETYAVALQTASVPGFGSPVQVGGSISISRDTVVPARFVIPVPPDTSMDRASRLNWALGGTTPSITYSAELLPQSSLQNDVSYPRGYSVG